jgi:TRAP-type uncharacterized transport system substrate-binding protein
MASRRRWLRLTVVGATVVVALLLGVLIANRFAGPLPPRRLVISTGREDGIYYQYALEYQRILAAQGFTLDVQPGPGSVDTLRRLVVGSADAGLVQGGTGPAHAAGVTALGSLFYEPLWIFHRKDLPVSYLSDLRGRRLAVGEDGSGTQALTVRLLSDNNVTAHNTQLVSLSATGAENALTSGEIDAAFFVVSPRAHVIHRLLAHRGVELMGVRRHLAYSGRHQFVASLHIGEGMLDIAGNIPREEKVLVGVTATLAVKSGIHPDHVRLLLNAVDRVHHNGGLLERPGQFPSEASLDLPLNEQARRYLRSGPSWLERTFPFWVAGLLDRLVLVILPVVTLLFPLFGLVFPLMDRRQRRRIARRYEALRGSAIRGESRVPSVVEREIEALGALRSEVVEETDVSLMYFGEVFHLTMHIDLVIERLERRRQALLEEDMRRKSYSSPAAESHTVG